MKTIRIPCDAVVIGDVLPASTMYPRRVVYGFHEHNHVGISPKTIDTSEITGVGNPPRMPTPREQWTPDMSVEVERAAELTPAQQHAEALVDLLRELADRGSAGHVDHNSLCGRARKLFDKIDPPQPPTLDEALRLLASWPSAHRTPLPPGDEPLTLTTEKLLDRARRSGVLP